MRHLRVKRTNVAHRLPRGKRAPGAEINNFQELQSVIVQLRQSLQVMHPIL
ncbi:hypothetical protein [Fictibacillus sp. UD]|uniref:hypothetical protein n=1 Tax=Fictibacillus sp. UD TaxID=3038777 RepID=UPI003748673D